MNRKISLLSTLLIGTCLASATGFVSQSSHTIFKPKKPRLLESSSKLEMAFRGGFLQEEARIPPPGSKRDHPLFAVAVNSDPTTFDERKARSIETSSLSLQSSWFESFMLPVLSSALLITGNTVGAGCLVMPELAAGPGLATTSAIFLGAYLVNLISGLAIAEVSIRQQESSGDEVPSSFKEFAEANLNSPVAASVVSGVSMSVNACVMAFALSRAGTVCASLLGNVFSPSIVSIGWSAVLMALMLTQSSRGLSAVASMCVTALFFSFGGLLLPGLQAVQAPIATISQPGTSPDLMESVMHAAPVILMSMIYQNVVPTVTKNLSYDRSKTMASIVCGSMIPLAMYLAWCYACLGGGVDTSVGLNSGGLMSLFSLATLAGSSICGGLSISEELDSFFVSPSPTDDSLQRNAGEDEKEGRFQVSSVLLAISVPLMGALTFGGGGKDFTEALGVAGGLGSPLLYGVLPATMALIQRQKSQEGRQADMVPAASLGALGILSTMFVGEELLHRASDTLSFLA